MNKKDRIQSRLNKGKYKTYYDYKTALSCLYRNELQNKPTEAENIFREYLKEKKIKHKFQKTFLKPFHRIVDFYIPRKKIIIEIDGGYHSTTAEKDKIKDEVWLNKRGCKTVRILNEQVYSGEFKSTVDNFIDI